MMKKIFNKKNITVFLIGIAVFLLILVLLNSVIFPWYVNSTEVKTPNVLGLNQQQAVDELRKANLNPMIAGSLPDTKYPSGSIMLQKPGPDKMVKEGRRVYLFVSTGEELVKVPRLLGLTLKDANILLVNQGLAIGQTKEVETETPNGTIFAQSIVEGTPVGKGTKIDVSISIKQVDTNNISLPSFLGRSLAEAQRILSDKGLTTGKIIYQPSESLLPNTVLDQYPSPGQIVARGQVVDLYVSKTQSKDKKKEEIIE